MTQEEKQERKQKTRHTLNELLVGLFNYILYIDFYQYNIDFILNVRFYIINANFLITIKEGILRNI